MAVEVCKRALPNYWTRGTTIPLSMETTSHLLSLMDPPLPDSWKDKERVCTLLFKDFSLSDTVDCIISYATGTLRFEEEEKAETIKRTLERRYGASVVLSFRKSRQEPREYDFEVVCYFSPTPRPRFVVRMPVQMPGNLRKRVMGGGPVSVVTKAPPPGPVTRARAASIVVPRRPRTRMHRIPRIPAP